MPDKPRIGLIGLGAMGLGMAACLVRSGFEVTGYDIQQRAIEKLVEMGGKAAQSPRAMAKRSDVLILVVATSEQATSVLFDDEMGAVAALPTNTIVLLCITASPEYVVELGQKLQAIDRSDLRLIDCPISGGETRAWKGTLSLLCAGKESDIDATMEVLECLSSKVHIVPGGAGAGSTLKLVHQILVGVHILASVEVMGLCHVAGLDPQSVYDNVMEGDGRSWLFEQRAAHILDEKRVPASSLAIITKDMATIEHCSSSSYGD
ncbi:hypothetical protein LTS07_004738 [Exophiala sideris]|nr:hypothetical protein LTS07_004738 [Exophiala sideris]